MDDPCSVLRWLGTFLHWVWLLGAWWGTGATGERLIPGVQYGAACMAWNGYIAGRQHWIRYMLKCHWLNYGQCPKCRWFAPLEFPVQISWHRSEGSESFLPSVLADHDRSQHAERQVQSYFTFTCLGWGLPGGVLEDGCARWDHISCNNLIETWWQFTLA